MVIVLLTLAVYRVTSLVVDERGPFAVFETVRKWFANLHPEGHELITCFWCVSFWVAVVLSLLARPSDLTVYVLYVLASSGGAILLDELRGNRDGPS